MSDVSCYSPGRARQIGILLWAAIVLAGLGAGLAGWLVATGFPPEAIVVAVPSLLIVTTSGVALRALREGTPGAKRWSILAGGVLILVGLFFNQTAASMLPSIVGILLVLLAMLSDHGDR